MGIFKMSTYNDIPEMLLIVTLTNKALIQYIKGM